LSREATNLGTALVTPEQGTAFTRLDGAMIHLSPLGKYFGAWGGDSGSVVETVEVDELDGI
jgi:hypothetical protein